MGRVSQPGRDAREREADGLPLTFARYLPRLRVGSGYEVDVGARRKTIVHSRTAYDAAAGATSLFGVSGA